MILSRGKTVDGTDDMEMDRLRDEEANRDERPKLPANRESRLPDLADDEPVLVAVAKAGIAVAVAATMVLRDDERKMVKGRISNTVDDVSNRRSVHAGNEDATILAAVATTVGEDAIKDLTRGQGGMAV